ncbi:MAG: hypothetical protein DHS20C08_13050 [Rhodomicrobium sp.]|nr:MAG: hypothetical protein DHS20C08_13050 [Rhodomicrobium sp.]
MELVLTAMSKDRPGIVEDIAAVIASHDGNWVQSSMAKLGGEFAGIVQFTAPEQEAEKLMAALVNLSEKGITIEIALDATQDHSGEGEVAVIELTGLDHKGIVHEITQMLREKNVMIDHLETNIYTASMAGEPMFCARAEIRLPENLTIDQLNQAAEAIAEDIMVEITLEIEENQL